MATARAIFQAHIDGLSLEAVPFTLLWSMADAVGIIEPIDLPQGDTMLSVPTRTSLILFQPAATTVAQLTLKGVTGDTGVRLRKNMGSVISWEAGPVLIKASVPAPGCFLAFL
jgi:hypothetical protein